MNYTANIPLIYPFSGVNIKMFDRPAGIMGSNTKNNTPIIVSEDRLVENPTVSYQSWTRERKSHENLIYCLLFHSWVNTHHKIV